MTAMPPEYLTYSPPNRYHAIWLHQGNTPTLKRKFAVSAKGLDSGDHANYARMCYLFLVRVFVYYDLLGAGTLLASRIPNGASKRRHLIAPSEMLCGNASVM